jgi:hypothetical protein
MLAALAASSTNEAGRRRRYQHAFPGKRHVSLASIHSMHTYPQSYHGNHRPRLQPPCCTARRLRSLFAFLLSASPVRIVAKCPLHRPFSLIRRCDWWALQFQRSFNIVASEICSGTGGQHAARYLSVSRTRGFEEAIPAACSRCLRLHRV